MRHDLFAASMLGLLGSADAFASGGGRVRRWGDTSVFRSRIRRVSGVVFAEPKSSLALSVEQVRRHLEHARKKAGRARDLVDLVHAQAAVRDLEVAVAQPGFWDDVDAAQTTIKELEGHKTLLSRSAAWDQTFGDCEAALEVAVDGNSGNEDPDVEMLAEAAQLLEGLEVDLDAWRLEALLGGPYDGCNARIVVTAGAGGTDAQDWAQMLVRMYTRWAERKGMSVKSVGVSDCDEGMGIRSAELEVAGPKAYGMLSGEKGTHRLVRISPFNSLGKRQTSFAGVETTPILGEGELALLDEVICYSARISALQCVSLWSAWCCFALG